MLLDARKAAVNDAEDVWYSNGRPWVTQPKP